MLNLKKTAVAVLAFGSSAVFAGTMGPVCTPGSVTVPCPRTAWDFGAQALYLNPSFPGLDHVGTVTNILQQSATSGRDSGHWGWGFQIEGSYHFNTGNDLNLNWYHIDRSKNQAVAIGAGQVLTGSSGLEWAGGTTLSVNGNAKWDAVNLEFGQHIDMGEFVNLRLHGGVEYARISTSRTSNGSLAAGNLIGVFVPATGFPTAGFYPAGTSQTVTRNNTYNGFGPRVGTDFGYGWNNGFDVYAKGAMAMLVGSSKYTRTSLVAYNGVGSVSSTTTIITPELEAKLGAKYTYAMAQGDLTLDLGWMFVNYFNALQSAPTSSLGGTRAVSDFGLQGPYLGLKWVGNVA